MSHAKIKKLALFAALLLINASALELAARFYWKAWHGVPLLRPEEILHVFYRDLEELRKEENLPLSGVRDILVLGGSVIHEMRPQLKRLEGELGHRIRLHVAARVAHTSLDSKRKYRELESLSYDEVLIYEGINDCKYDNIPDELFDAEYTAYPFYASVAALYRHHERKWFALPFTLDFLRIQYRFVGAQRFTTPTRWAVPAWHKFGAEVKSAGTYRQNLEEILQRAEQRGQRVTLATFANYIPDDYTEERFSAKTLDYASYRLSARVWGTASNVKKCIAVHNRIVRDLAEKNPWVHLIDFENAVPSQGRYFVDPCHFSPEGARLFIEHLGRALRARDQLSDLVAVFSLKAVKNPRRRA